MPVTVNSPYSGRPVKVRDQDVGRAVRDEDGRVFYVVPRASGEGFYAAPTRKGSEKDEQRYDEMLEKMERSDEQVKAVSQPPRDATGRKRRRPAVTVAILLLLAAAVAAGYFVLVEGDGPAAKWFDAVVGNGASQPADDEDTADTPASSPNDTQPENDTDTDTDTDPDAKAEPGADAGTQGGNAASEGLSRHGVSQPSTNEAAIFRAMSLEPHGAQVDPEAFTRLDAGLIYRTDREGAGPPAAAGQYVELRYRHKHARNAGRIDALPWQTTSLVLSPDDAPRGWERTILGMRPGERRTALLPASTTGVQRYDVAQFQLITVRPGIQTRTNLRGTGTVARPGDSVSVHYQGFVVRSGSGSASDAAGGGGGDFSHDFVPEVHAEPFADSRDAGGPARFTLGEGEMIEGLELGVAGMRVGEVRSIIIPPHLAYGSKSIGEVVPAHSTLLFVVELLEVE